MRKRDLIPLKPLLVLGALTILTGCGSTSDKPPVQTAPPPAATAPPASKPSQQPDSPAPKPADPGKQPAPAPAGENPPAVTVTAKPADVAVLVNKQVMLPDGYKPADLVEPNVRFIFSEKDEKRLMRKVAAQALEAMFAGAEKDGIYLAGVSGYRSYETQVGLFNYYVKTQGEETARKYSAEPGHSEHQTGLAMDVSGSTGKCAADDCFAGTPEAVWLAANAPKYGFIIRYPKGKEAVTGYAYEPWHVRYVGKPMSEAISAKGLTLEEYEGAVH